MRSRNTHRGYQHNQELVLQARQASHLLAQWTSRLRKISISANPCRTLYTQQAASLVGSFFFLRGAGDCSRMGGLIPPLSYQISTYLPTSGHDGQHCRPQASQRQLHNDFHILGKAISMRTHVKLLWSRPNDELSTGRIECDVWGGSCCS